MSSINTNPAQDIVNNALRETQAASKQAEGKMTELAMGTLNGVQGAMGKVAEARNHHANPADATAGAANANRATRGTTPSA